MKNISLQLTDFKCHKDTSIALNNLTLLTGANAAGCLKIRRRHCRGRHFD